MGTAIRADEIRTLAEYESARAELKRQAVALRRLRRVELGEEISLVFENRDTVLFQIHETMRAEGITDRELLQAECDIYATMLPGAGCLSAALTVCLASGRDPAHERRRLVEVERKTAMVIGGESVTAEALTGMTMGDNGTVKKYVRFRLNEAQRSRFRDDRTDVRIRFGHPDLRAEGVIGPETRRLLAEDLT